MIVRRRSELTGCNDPNFIYAVIGNQLITLALNLLDTNIGVIRVYHSSLNYCIRDLFATYLIILFYYLCVVRCYVHLSVVHRFIEERIVHLLRLSWLLKSNS